MSPFIRKRHSEIIRGETYLVCEPHTVWDEISNDWIDIPKGEIIQVLHIGLNLLPTIPQLVYWRDMELNVVRVLSPNFGQVYMIFSKTGTPRNCDLQRLFTT